MSAQFDYQDSEWVAKVLHLDVSTVESLMLSGDLPGTKIGPKWLVSEGRLSDFLIAKEATSARGFGREKEYRIRIKGGGVGSVPTVPIARRARRGVVRYRLLERATVESSYRDMLIEVLRTLSQFDPTFLAHFSKERGRKRQYVAQNAADLYPGQPDLVRKFKEPLGTGWWVGTNYSAAEIEQILRKAIRVAGLQWGRDLAIETGDEAEQKNRALSIIGIASDSDPDASIRHDDLFVETVRNE